MKNLAICFVVVIGLISVSCDKHRFEAGKLAVKWKLIENNLNGESKFKSAFRLINNGKTDLPESGWRLYFNVVPFIDSASVTGNCVIRHINGDLYALEPRDGFTLHAGDSIEVEYVSSDWSINYSDAPSGPYFVEVSKEGKESKPVVVANFAIIPFDSQKQTTRSKEDVLPVTTSETLYERYAARTDFRKADLIPIIPRPVKFTKGPKTFPMKKLFVNAPELLAAEKKFLLENIPAVETNDSLAVILEVKDDKQFMSKSGAYHLGIGMNGIRITGKDADGVFNGIQSLRQLLLLSEAIDSAGVPQVDIIDYPSLQYRGVHLDVARNFQSKETVKKLLDLMAFYKLNKFHFHLSDDEGWRLEIKSLPELTTFGSKRYHDPEGKALQPSFGSGPFADNPAGSGYYTEDDFIDILRYAKERHIEVIPKIDMPGHARAAVKSMDYRFEQLLKAGKTEEASEFLLRDPNDQSVYRSVQLWNDNVMCICQQSTYHFIETVVDDVQKLYDRANVRLTTFHIGADEVPHGAWEKSPACAQMLAEKSLKPAALSEYFFETVNTILSKRNIALGGWEEIALRKSKKGNSTLFEPNPKFVNAGFRPYVWNSVWGWEQEDVGYKLANAGYKVVLGNVTNLYFDLAYDKHPEEPGYYWGGFVDTQTVFEFNPYNIFINADRDKLGRKISPELWQNRVALQEKAKENILGIQGQLWAENLKTADQLMYMAFPKMLSLAERAWNPQPRWSIGRYDNGGFEKDWSSFAAVIGFYHLPYLDQKDIRYRISPPGAIIQNGKLLVNTEYPATTIRFTTDGSEPQITSAAYVEPVNVTGTVKLKSFNLTNRSSRTVTVTPACPE